MPYSPKPGGIQDSTIPSVGPPTAFHAAKPPLSAETCLNPAEPSACAAKTFRRNVSTTTVITPFCFVFRRDFSSALQHCSHLRLRESLILQYPQLHRR